MKFKVGDIIEVTRSYWQPFKGRNVGVLGRVVDVRRYGRYSPSATHYLVKFTCYKIPHVYFISDIDDICELYKVKRG
jgi:hypothetical protein